MILLIATSPNVKNEQIEEILEHIEIPTSIVLAGIQRDKVIEQWANRHSIPVEKIVAHTRYHREYASFIRNERIAEYADAGVIVYDGRSMILKHLAMRFRARLKPLTIYRLENQRATRLSWRASSSSAPEKQRVQLRTVGARRVAPSS